MTNRRNPAYFLTSPHLLVNEFIPFGCYTYVRRHQFQNEEIVFKPCINSWWNCIHFSLNIIFSVMTSGKWKHICSIKVCTHVFERNSLFSIMWTRGIPRQFNLREFALQFEFQAETKITIRLCVIEVRSFPEVMWNIWKTNIISDSLTRLSIFESPSYIMHS